MLKTHRTLGGILLIAGTAIGAGMLALPVISGFGGFIPSFILLVVCWLFMTSTAFLLLEVNLTTPGESNLISMAGRTIGFWGKAVCWIAYLLLLYALLAAYIAGCAPLILDALDAMTGFRFPFFFGPLILLVFFGLFVYLGTRTVDWVNRILMMGLIFSYFLLLVLLPPHVQPRLLAHADFKAAWLAFPVVITSFGFHIIIPSLTTYLQHDRRKLYRAIAIGSLIPLIVYALWEFFVLGIVPLQGPSGLFEAWQQGQSGAAPLAAVVKNRWVASAAHSFSFFAIITSFLGVSLSLSDFLTDGLKMKRYGFGREVACLLTFVPPLLFALFSQRGFLLALQFAGIFVAILLGILPALMAWTLPAYRSWFKKGLLCGVILFSLLIIVLAILEQSGHLSLLIHNYVQPQSRI